MGRFQRHYLRARLHAHVHPGTARRHVRHHVDLAENGRRRQLPLPRPDRLKPRTRVELTEGPRRLRLLLRGSRMFHVLHGVGEEYPGLRRTGTFGMWLFLGPPAGALGTENFEQGRADDLVSPLETVTDDLFRRG